MGDNGGGRREEGGEKKLRDRMHSGSGEREGEGEIVWRRRRMQEGGRELSLASQSLKTPLPSSLPNPHPLPPSLPNLPPLPTEPSVPASRCERASERARERWRVDYARHSL